MDRLEWEGIAGDDMDTLTLPMPQMGAEVMQG